MKPSYTPGDDKIADSGSSAEPGYAAWKRAKIESALRQASDRSCMIPEDQVWRELGLER
jgi:hypothetical protein